MKKSPAEQLLPLAGAGLLSLGIHCHVSCCQGQGLPPASTASIVEICFSIHTELFLRTYGIIFPYVRKYFSVHTELFLRTYGIIFP